MTERRGGFQRRRVRGSAYSLVQQARGEVVARQGAGERVTAGGLHGHRRFSSLGGANRCIDAADVVFVLHVYPRDSPLYPIGMVWWESLLAHHSQKIGR